MKSPLQHRHKLALPVFGAATVMVLALLSMGAGTGVMRTQGITLASTDTVRTVALSSDSVALLQPATAVEITSEKNDLTLTRGQMSVIANDLLTAHVGSVTAYATYGAFALLRDTDSQTIASLTAPVLLDTGSETLLLPPGMQYRMQGETHALSLVPETWLQQELAAFPMQKDTHQQFDGITPLTASLLQERASEIATKTGKEAAAALPILAALQAGQPITDDVAEAQVAVLLSSEASRDTYAQTIVQIARMSGKPLASPFIAHWSDAAIRLGTADSTAALDALALAADATKLASARGLPIQATLWERAVTTASPILRTIARSDQERMRVASAVESVYQAKSPLSASLGDTVIVHKDIDAPAVDIDPVALLSSTHAMLFTRGALQTGNTTVELDAQHPGWARVRSVFKEENGALVLYAFSYSPETDTIAYIVRGFGEGEMLPNAVSSEVFFH